MQEKEQKLTPEQARELIEKMQEDVNSVPCYIDLQAHRAKVTNAVGTIETPEMHRRARQ